MEYKLVIGLEIHVQLGLKTKAFCGCKNEFGGVPNSRVCPICLGLPGSLPSVNVELINSAILAGMPQIQRLEMLLNLIESIIIIQICQRISNLAK